MFVCFIEFVDIVEKYNQFKVMGVEVYFVSIDLYFVYKVWYDVFESICKIIYLMLVDFIGVLLCVFGVMIEEDGMVYCGIFVVNFEGKIKLVEIQDNSIGCNVDEFFCKVEVVQFVVIYDGEVCFVKWKKGVEILKLSIDLVGKI